LEKAALEHPHHTLFQIFALTAGGEATGAQSDDDKTRAAKGQSEVWICLLTARLQP
jgi:hypothetical protein